MAMQNPQQVWQDLAAELGAIDIAMQGAYNVFSCIDEEEVKVRILLYQINSEGAWGVDCSACRVSP